MSILWVGLCILPLSQASGQTTEDRPKLALVLSGGGAKGLAHIPLLQLLDSLQVKPDLVVGTSMGSIVGGLYAMGYSGDTLETISVNTDWSYVLGGTVQYQDVIVGEKDEFGRYALELGLNKFKPESVAALVRDQHLREYLATLSFPAHEITDFDKLPIAYRAIAVDVLTGTEVVMSSGSVQQAMRASMAIPSIFKPVELGDMLLVDGGVMNNFPVNIARELGADVVIGSDVAGGAYTKEELKNVTNLLFQTGMLQSNLRQEDQRASADFFVDHDTTLTYSTASFSSAAEIIEQGRTATNLAKDSLLAVLAPFFSEKKTFTFPEHSPKIAFDSLIAVGVDEDLRAFIRQKLRFELNKPYTVEEIIAMMDLAMGTTFFKELDYQIIDEDGRKVLKVTAEEKLPLQVKTSLHYDNELGIGLLINATGRNILGRNSRVLGSLDIAESPKIRLQYQKYFIKSRRLWTRTSFFNDIFDRGFFINGERVEDLRARFWQVRQDVNWSVGQGFLGVGVFYDHRRFKPKVDPDVITTPLSLRNYELAHAKVEVNYYRNSFDKVFFPTRGQQVNIRVNRTLWNDVRIENVADSVPTIAGAVEGSTRVYLDYQFHQPLNDHYTLIGQVAAGLTFLDDSPDDLSYLDNAAGEFYTLGGAIERPRVEEWAFLGLKDGEITVPQQLRASLGLQIRPFGSVYLIPHINAALVGNASFNDFIDGLGSASSNWASRQEANFVISGGVTAAYQSLLGPIFLDFSRVNDIDDFRLAFGFGYQFHRTY